MFIKITKSKNNQYVQLVESYRENGKTKHKTLLNLGRLEEIKNNPNIQRLAKRLLELASASKLVDLCSASEAKILNWDYLVYQRIWNQFDLPKLLKKLVAKLTANLVQEIMIRKVHPEQAFRACMGIIRLSKSYTKERVENAAKRALAYGAISYQSVLSILQKNLDSEALPEYVQSRPLYHENIRFSLLHRGGE